MNQSPNACAGMTVGRTAIRAFCTKPPVTDAPTSAASDACMRERERETIRETSDKTEIERREGEGEGGRRVEGKKESRGRVVSKRKQSI